MTFAHPFLLLSVVVLAIGGIWLFAYSQRVARRRLSQFSAAIRLSSMLRTVNFRAKKIKYVLLLTSLGLLMTVLARPLWGPRPNSAEQTGVEFFVILDVSKSMLVRDVPPSRLEAVKETLAEWLKKRYGDRIGLILMSGDAFIQAPLTNDFTALREVLGQSGPKSLSLGGTNISAAVKVASKALEASGVKNKAIVIISDGENTEGHVVAEIQQAHTQEKITFFTVGVGTVQGGPVPVRELPKDFVGEVKDVVRDEYGIGVKSSLDERNLRAISAAGGGRYFAYQGLETWEDLYTQSLSTLARKSETFKLEDYMDLFQFPLFVVILLLILEAGISTRYKNPSQPVSVVTLPEPSSQPTATTMESQQSHLLRSSLFLAFTLAASSLSAAGIEGGRPLMQQADAMIKEGRAAEAVEILRDASQKAPGDFYLLYNYGVAAYSAKQYSPAVDAFSEVCATQDKKLRAMALAQLGNAHFRLAESIQKHNRGGAVVALERAVEYYSSAERERSGKMSETNGVIARQKLEKLLLELGDQFRAEAAKNTQPNSIIVLLTKAHESFDKASTVNPENETTRQKLEETAELLAKQLAMQARTLREKSDNLPPAKNQQSEQEKLNVQASQAYQQARELTPKDEALAREHDEFKAATADKLTDTAAERMAQAMEPTEKNTQGDIKKKRERLEQALNQVGKALAFDEENARAQSMQKDILKHLENAHVEYADRAKAAGDTLADKSPEASAGNYNEAIQQYQKALAINPENAHAEASLSEVQNSLAEQLTKVGKKEMAQALDPNAGKKPAEKKAAQEPAGENAGETPPEPNAGQLRENIGRLEKAAQSFAQAEALQPGENEAKALQAEATEKLNEMRSTLDQMQSQQGGPQMAANGQPGEPSQEGQPAEGQEPGEQPSEQPGMGGPNAPVKPTLSFSEARGSTQLEGIFKKMTNKPKIRDW